MFLQPMQRYEQMCMCTEALWILWIQEIKPLFNSIKTLIYVFEFAIYSLELEMNLEKIFPTYLPHFFFHAMLAESHFFFLGLSEFCPRSLFSFLLLLELYCVKSTSLKLLIEAYLSSCSLFFLTNRDIVNRSCAQEGDMPIFFFTALFFNPTLSSRKPLKL